MLKYRRLVLGQLQTNTYLLYSDRNNDCYIIDPADDATTISDEILSLKLKPKAILLTHGHFDHVLAVSQLQLIFNIPLYCGRQDFFLLEKINQSASHWLKRPIKAVKISKIDYDLDQIEYLSLDNIDIHLLKTPGHTPGGYSFYIPPQKLLFSGDTLFKQGIGRTDFSYANPTGLKKSLSKLSKLPPQTLVLPGHGQPTTINQELKHFL